MNRQDINATDTKAVSLFSDTMQRKRYLFSLVMILLMIGVAELLHEKEIIFPEMAALTIGMWIVDKRVWKIKQWQMLLLMTLGACAGVLIVLCSPLPLVLNVAMAFLFAAVCLLCPRFVIPFNIGMCVAGAVTYRELGISFGGLCHDFSSYCSSAVDGTERNAENDCL